MEYFHCILISIIWSLPIIIVTVFTELWAFWRRNFSKGTIRGILCIVSILILCYPCIVFPFYIPLYYLLICHLVNNTSNSAINFESFKYPVIFLLSYLPPMAIYMGSRYLFTRTYLFGGLSMETIDMINSANYLLNIKKTTGSTPVLTAKIIAISPDECFSAQSNNDILYAFPISEGVIVEVGDVIEFNPLVVNKTQSIRNLSKSIVFNAELREDNIRDIRIKGISKMPSVERFFGK